MAVSGARIIAGIELIWETLKTDHPDLPDVTVVLDTAGARHNLAWPEHEGTLGGKPDLPVNVEALRAGPRAVLEAVLHAATHALCHVRGISDTSNRGQRHNKRFAAMAKELGMTWPQDNELHPVKGYSPIPVDESTATRFAPLMEALAPVLAAEVPALEVVVPEKGKSGTRLNLVCGCGRTMQMGKRVYDQGPVTCGVCGTNFVVNQHR
ncbi:hypothetical protein ACFC0S_03130 [Streptomyces sp. NPDC056084]|uniref:hypothetical protein n=1 Tax=unclassified Streptomyces TaxID=2593676 RepID=UPI0035E0FFBE